MPSSEPAAGLGRQAFSFEQLERPPEPPRSVHAPVSMDAARNEASALVAQAQAEAEGIRRTAFDHGREEGHAAGMAAAAERLDAAAAAMRSAAERIDLLRHDVSDAVERDAVELAFSIAEKVLAGAFAVQPERVVDVVTGALRGLVERDRVLVQVAPEDLELVREAAERISASLGGLDRLEIQSERRVERGGALVVTADGEVDARIETKLSRAREVVEAELRR